jgi:DNA-binding MarR family transcriptional regulator
MGKQVSTPGLTKVGEGKRGEGGHIAYLLRQAQAAVRLALDSALSDAGLTTPQFLVLNLLNAYPGVSGADLARIASLTPQTVNLIVRKLERDKLIGRTSHETHGRVLRLELTDEGRTVLRQCKLATDKVEQRLLAFFDQPTEIKVRKWLTQVASQIASDAPNTRGKTPYSSE